MDYLPLPIHDIHMVSMSRFFENVDYKIISGCWIWIGKHTGDNGYGRRAPYFRLYGKYYVATRIMYYYHYKINPESYCVCHNCLPNEDNPSCVNPHHLWLGTQSDNLLDAVDKGMQGSKGNRKVTDNQIRQIRHEYWDLHIPTMEIVRKYGMDRTAISKIIHYHTFKDIV